MSAIHDKNKLIERQSILSKPTFDLSHVTVARFSVNGKNHELSSLMPLTLSRFKNDQGESITLLAFNKKQDHLTLFTHDALSSKGYEISLPLEEFKSKRKILFPVVNAKNGHIEDAIFEITNIIER